MQVQSSNGLCIQTPARLLSSSTKLPESILLLSTPSSVTWSKRDASFLVSSTSLSGHHPVPLQQIAADKLLAKSLAQASRRALYDDSSTLQSRNLGVGTTLATRDNSTGVAHTTSWRRRDTSNEAHHRLTSIDNVVLAQEVGGILLSRATNLTNHDDAVGLGVVEEDLEAVDEVGAGEGVTTNADNERLAQTGLGGLVDGLVGQSAGTGDDADAAALVDEAGHDADLALAGGDEARAVGADETGLGLGLEHGSDAHHVLRELCQILNLASTGKSGATETHRAEGYPR